MSSPKAAWLKKKTCTMGRIRWQSRFFVLLETELRYYKDEYAVTSNYIWNLRDMVDIKRDETICSLSLEPRLSSRHKPLTLLFSSKIEMQEWLDHLADRCILPPPTPRTSSLGRRRGIILSSLIINNIEDDAGAPSSLPSLDSPTPSSTVSASSSTSSIATLVHQEPPSPPPPMIQNTIDDTASPTYLKYKDQFRL